MSKRLVSKKGKYERYLVSKVLREKCYLVIKFDLDPDEDDDERATVMTYCLSRKQAYDNF
jgi:hypothetical protein